MNVQDTPTPSSPPPLNPHAPPPGSRFTDPTFRGLLIGLLVAFLGIFALGVIAFSEKNWLKDQAWVNAILASDFILEDEAVIPVRVRSVPKENFPDAPEWIEMLRATEDGRDLIEAAGLEKTELIVAAALSPDELAPLLESGRLPARGAPELLAGSLVRLETFTMDGIQFQVVGKLHPAISGFAFAYLLPDDPALGPLFSPDAGATEGTVHPEGLTKLGDLLNTDAQDAQDAQDGEEEEKEEKIGAPKILGGRALTTSIFAWGTWAALLLAMTGGAFAQIQFLKILARRRSWIFQPFLLELVQRPRLLLGTHVALLGMFFGFMAYGLTQPLLCRQIMNYISMAFSEGDLRYIGDAYASGNILLAAKATFTQNYLLNTLVLTFGLSVVPLAVGALKTAASFGIVGLGMTPLWVGTATGYSYHSITMILELEPYVIASFVVLVWPIRLVRGLLTGDLKGEAVVGMRVFLGGIVATGVMLAVAALYEATTLILLR